MNRLLIDSVFEPNDLNDALNEACYLGHLPIVNRLLEDERVDPGYQNSASIRNASVNGHVDVVDRLLLDKRVDPTALDNDALHLALHTHHNVVNRLMKDRRVVIREEALIAYRFGVEPAFQQ